MSRARTADLLGSDPYVGETPQAIEDRANDAPFHDEPEHEPGSGEYNFFYGNGQLHVSPAHADDHSALAGHAGIGNPAGHAGPVAVGSVSVDAGRATFQVAGNVGLAGFQRILRDYADQVGWKWGGLVDLGGNHLHDSFAPKRSVYLKDNETGEILPFALQGKTAFVGKLSADQRKAVAEAGYKLAEYPGGGDMNDMLHNNSPAGEDYEQWNLGDNKANPVDRTDPKDPGGTFRCPQCHERFPNWKAYADHRADELGMDHEQDQQDGHFPEMDMDVPLPPHFVDRQPYVMPLASFKEASRIDGIEESFPWVGDRTEFYVAYRGGFPVGVAAVDNGVYLGASGDPTVEASLISKIASRHERLDWGLRPYEVMAAATGQQPKDMIEEPVPFIYDVDKDEIVVGHPGSRHSDIMGEFTPGGIVEGTYEPGGKVVFRTMTDMPFSVRHVLDLWYWSHPQMELTGLEMEDAEGNRTKLAGTHVGAQGVGQYIKTLAVADPAAWQSYQALRKAGGKVYVVGGAVRDALLQKKPKDIDLMVTGVSPDEVRRVLEAAPGSVDLTGKDFGVFRYRHKGEEVEIALPRTERSTGDRRVDFDVQVDHNLPIEDDLLRRDFTVNAMAVDLDSGKLVDPYKGAQDIEDRKLRTVHPSSFEEDPTRLVRALVASSRHGLVPTEATRQEMVANAHRIPREAQERIQAELDKLFKSSNPAGAIRLAQETGVLRHILPEVANEFDFDQNNPHHSYTLGEHLLNVLDNVSSQSTDPDLRLAALLHDIGKPRSAWTNPETGYNHYYLGPNGEGADHAQVGAEMADIRLRHLKYPVARINRIRDLIHHHMFPAFSSPKGARKFLHNTGDHADDLLTLRWADQHGKGQTPDELAARTSVEHMRGAVEQVRNAQEPTSRSGLSINGQDILALGVPAGPDVGRILRLLTNDVIENPALNDRGALLQRATEYANASEGR